MAAATITNTSYGFNVKTGTDATTVTSDKVRVKQIEVMGTAGSETVIVTDLAGNGLLKAVAVANKSGIFDLDGARIDGLIVTLSASTIRANIFIE